MASRLTCFQYGSRRFNWHSATGFVRFATSFLFLPERHTACVTQAETPASAAFASVQRRRTDRRTRVGGDGGVARRPRGNASVVSRTRGEPSTVL
jgi:hypothetical protein